MGNDNCLIRIAEDNDLQGIMSLLVQLLPDDPIISDGRDRSVFNQIQRDPNLQLFVLTLDGTIISTCYLNIIPNLTRHASPYAVIENVITDESMQRKGYGKQLIQFVLDYAWRAGCYKVMLLSAIHRDDAHRFYEACGFDPNEKQSFVARTAAFKHD
ncbi:MAG: GNAT family N-acetyltransferase [Chloroflexi bacterium]|jgi:GNAT superfamily N-acetyltransferase|nr:GNAT family N-acetyltransferase [Chloroflexota bacterium]MBT7080382.1 GNAT family N-acetyltransferase [Chloroflexota bacterium]MBT7289448.1 GNAT family N-acetyltransferase [Chloroflexota bacterium]